MSAKNILKVGSFCIFNPTYGKTEFDEDKKLLYFYPEEESLDVKLRDIGVAQALISFTRIFSPDKPLEVVHTLKTRQIYLEAEENFWMVLTLLVPSQQRQRDNQMVTEYLHEDVQDDAILSALRMIYQQFRAFVGSFELVLNEVDGDMQIFRQRLEEYFDKVVHQLRPQNIDILDIFHGINFLPLDKAAFLQIESFVNHVENTYKRLLCSVFLCNDQLVWSGLSMFDMQLLYHYLLSDVLQGALEAELLPALSPFRGNTSSARFLCTASGTVGHTMYIRLDQQGSSVSVSTTSSNTHAPYKKCHLLIYRALSATFCMIVDGATPLGQEFIDDLQQFLAPQMLSLANSISKQYSKLHNMSSSSSSSRGDWAPQKYVYFNRMNLAQKSWIHTERRSGFQVPPEVMRLLVDFNTDLAACREWGECFAKTTHDWWIVAKTSDCREFYVVLNQKNANICQVNVKPVRKTTCLKGPLEPRDR